MHILNLLRRVGQRTGDTVIQSQVDFLIERGLKGPRGNGWEVIQKTHKPTQIDGLWCFKTDLTFTKTSGRGIGSDVEHNQWENIKAMIIQTGQNAQFGKYPWQVVENSRISVVETVMESTDREITPNSDATSLTEIVSDIGQVVKSKIGGLREVNTFTGEVKKWSDLVVPPELLGRESNHYLAQHPAWSELYGINPQIRTLLSNIKRAHDTDGMSRNHGVLYGHAGCGKTTTLLALEQMFGPGSVLRLDATSTTRAGLEKLFFSNDGLTEIPPLVFMEEAEKADVEALKIWLGALDDRGEIRKVNYRVNQLRELKVLFICAVNNKTLFDRMMGSDGTEAGALSSRCVSQIYFPRPSEMVLRQILLKEIARNGGEERWISPAILLANDLGVTDARIVRSYLAGGDRLMDGSYQEDWLAIREAAKAFRKE